MVKCISQVHSIATIARVELIIIVTINDVLTSSSILWRKLFLTDNSNEEAYCCDPNRDGIEQCCYENNDSSAVGK